jgi:hypothetical protein
MTKTHSIIFLIFIKIIFFSNNNKKLFLVFDCKPTLRNYTMVEETYDYFSLPDVPFYVFRSEGQQGQILKGILFTPTKDNL